MDLSDKIITLENNKKYIVIEIVEYNGDKYIYLVNEKEEIDSIFRKLTYNGILQLEEIEQNLFIEKIYPLFLEKFNSYE